MNKEILAQEIRLRRSADWGAVYFHGKTMLPFLQEGDLLVVVPVAWGQLRVGDVVTYRDDDKFPTRRIVWIDRRREVAIIMGDSIPDRRRYRVPRSEVLGRVVSRERAGRTIGRHHPIWYYYTLKAILKEYLRELRYRFRRLRAW